LGLGRDVAPEPDGPDLHRGGAVIGTHWKQWWLTFFAVAVVFGVYLHFLSLQSLVVSYIAVTMADKAVRT
jgi:hypothetical protein